MAVEVQEVVEVVVEAIVVQVVEGHMGTIVGEVHIQLLEVHIQLLQQDLLVLPQDLQVLQLEELLLLKLLLLEGQQQEPVHLLIATGMLEQV